MPPWGGERQRRARQRREAPTLNPGRGTAVCAPFGRRSRRPGPQGASAPSTCSPRRPREYDAGHRAVLLEHEQSGCQGHDEQKYDHQQREPSRPCLTLPAARSRLRAGVTHGGCHQLSPLWWLVCSASSRRAMAVDGRGQVPDAAPRAQRALSVERQRSCSASRTPCGPPDSASGRRRHGPSPSGNSRRSRQRLSAHHVERAA